MLKLGFSSFCLRGPRTDALHFAKTMPPTGFRWEFITSDGVLVCFGGEPTVALVRI